MPKHYKAQLNHKAFDWLSAFDQILAELESRREQVLEIVGFYDEYERTNDPTRAAHIRVEADGVLRDIASALATAAAIFVDGGFKPAQSVIATVRAVFRNPGLIHRDTIEPEARGIIANNYQREAETPGTHREDLMGDLTAAGSVQPTIHPERIRAACQRAIAELQKAQRRGRRQDVTGDYLALKLGGIFNRFAGPIKRAVLPDGYRHHRGEVGRFKAFLNLVLVTLEAVLQDYNAGSRPVRFSRDSLVGKALKCHPTTKQRRS